MENLKFRRQFLLSSIKTNKLENWNADKIGSYFLYVHKDCHLQKFDNGTNEIYLVGYFFNPNMPSKTELSILEDLSLVNSVDSVSSLIYPLVGRFVLLIKLKEEYYVFNDACGLRSVYCYQDQKEFYLASQPTLFKLLTNLSEGEKYRSYYESDYVKSNKEHWIPSGGSLYENVTHLVPNHFLKFRDGEQIRFWPKEKVEKRSLGDAQKKFSEILKSTMTIANKRFNLALAITAGWDSRILLSACKEISNEIDFYTLQYRNMQTGSTDIKISKKLINSLGYEHKVFDCGGFQDEDFLEIYAQNSGMPHVDDWGSIANGIFHAFSPKAMAVKGNCTEIGRCYYYENGNYPEIISSRDILELEYNWNTVEFIPKEIEEWHQNAVNIFNDYSYKELDLFYWEHRMGSWQAQSQLEWDIAQEVFTPFNNRELIDVMLSVDSLHRHGPQFDFFQNVINMLWPEILQIPINPKTNQEKIRKFIRLTFKKLKVLRVFKSLIDR